jgi:hypothetical protein
MDRLEEKIAAVLLCWLHSFPLVDLTFTIFGLLFGLKLLLNARTLMSRYFLIFFSALRPIQGHKVQHLLVTWGRLKIFFLFQSWLSKVRFVIK